MGKRIKVSISYSYNQNWIGGTYYIQNLIASLNTLDDRLKPELFIASSSNDYADLVTLTNYPYLKLYNNHKHLNLFFRIVNKLSRVILRKNIIDSRIIKNVISFPGYDESSKNFNKRSLFWITDFQDKHLPHFFSQEELDRRHKSYKKLIRDGKYVVFSSKDAKKDFNKFYPENSLQQFVLEFAVTHPILKRSFEIETLEKFALTSHYFICCNQIWAHKNHKTLLNAIAILKTVDPKCKIVFTGKNYDHRNSDLYNDLEEQIRNLKIQENVLFLGFIERDEQIVLIKNAMAIIQPSLFEGWSTVIEDAKAQNKYIIASDIPVHREQLLRYNSKSLFSAMDHRALALEMLNLETTNFQYDYSSDIKEFGSKFFNIIEFIDRV